MADRDDNPAPAESKQAKAGPSEKLKKYWTRGTQYFKTKIQDILGAVRVGDGVPVLTFILALMAYLQWHTFEKTDETLKAAQRPWILMSEVSAPNAPSRVGGDWALRLTFKMENVGNGPAQVIVRWKPVPYGQDAHRVIAERCDSPFSKSELEVWNLQWTIFPKQSFDFDGGIERSPANNDIDFRGAVSGCVIYESTVDRRRHKSGFLAEPRADFPSLAFKKPVHMVGRAD